MLATGSATRDATADDLNVLADMGERFVAASYPRLGITRDELAGLVLALLDTPKGFVRVLERDGAVVGMLWAAVVPVLPTSAVEVGREIAWWVNPEHRGGGAQLMRDYDAWCDGFGVERFASELVSPSLPESPARLYERMGYERCEVAWIKGAR